MAHARLTSYIHKELNECKLTLCDQPIMFECAGSSRTFSPIFLDEFAYILIFVLTAASDNMHGKIFYSTLIIFQNQTNVAGCGTVKEKEI